MKRMLWGRESVRRALESGADPDVILIDGADPDRTVRAMLAPTQHGRLPVYERPRRELDALTHDSKHEGIVMISGNFTYTELETVLSQSTSSPLLLCLDEITDPGNVGSILRTSAAFGVNGVIVPKDRSAPINGAVVRVSMAATELVPVARVTNLSRTLQSLGEDGYATVGLDANAEHNLEDLDLSGPIALVLGSEGYGLRRLVRERCTHLAKIPMKPPMDSLNVAVATAVALYECQRQRARTR
ncbi:MAG: 23S rRNA (guanosine(2251)-2'-O)-methyltransferase RlmB [Deltaproteobacteria bacterium]|nr:23S rRNA (guanosine(2251)-2'-O)-methyltransferase RlmB [Deltaproteobacteria bacterium]